MRRLLAVVLVVGAAWYAGAGSSATGSPATASDPGGASSAAVEAPRVTPYARLEATRALRAADRVLSGRSPRADGSMALLRLRQTMGALPPSRRREARAILARPTDDPDPDGEMYHAPAKRECSKHICIHWVTTTRDAAPSQRWVDKMLHLMNHVWAFETGRLGYRQPVSDGTRGGGGPGRFDVYLKELFHQNLYGLTVPEKVSKQSRGTMSAYLLLDNDFKRSQYHRNPMQEARVTAAHEFFHAIQDAYDAREDRWLMESTATWMEEQFDDSSNDNRQYLPWSQLHKPGTPLDTYSTTSFEEYGNWVFFEYLSERFGLGVVQAIWEDAAAYHGGDEYSAAAIRTALRTHGGMTRVFGDYASGNTVPARTYAEGGHYPAAGAAATVALTRSSPQTAWTTYRVRHLAAVDVEARPGRGLAGHRWRLRVQVAGPPRSTMPAVVVLVDRGDQPTVTRRVHLSRDGSGSVLVPFREDTTRHVTVTLANTSTRFTCHTGTIYSCNGTPDAPDPAFRLRLRAVRP